MKTNKIIIATIIMTIINNTAHLAASTYEVINNSKQGYSIEADNFVKLITPEGKIIKITNFPFITKNSNIEPIAPIICSWDPTGNWLTIFIPTRQITGINIVNLKTNKLMSPEPFDRADVYPDWYSSPMFSTKTTPVPNGWIDNTLKLKVVVKLKNGETKTMYQLLTMVNDTTTSIHPLPPEEEATKTEEEAKTSKLSPTPSSTQPSNKRAIQF